MPRRRVVREWSGFVASIIEESGGKTGFALLGSLKVG
jgi:hypothetical protein